MIYVSKEPLMVIDNSYREQQKRLQFVLISKDGVPITREMMDAIVLSDDSEEIDVLAGVGRDDIEVVVRDDSRRDNSEINDFVVRDEAEIDVIVSEDVDPKKTGMEIEEAMMAAEEIIQVIEQVEDEFKYEPEKDLRGSLSDIEKEIEESLNASTEDVREGLNELVKNAVKTLNDLEVNVGESLNNVDSLNTENMVQYSVEKDDDDDYTIKDYKDCIEKNDLCAEIEALSINPEVHRKHSLLDTVKIAYQLEEIFAVKDKKPVPIELNKSIFKDFKPSRRRVSPVEVFRYELNTLALTNYEQKIFKLKNIDGNEDDFKEMAKFIYEKAIAEPTFTDIYAKMVKELKPTFRTPFEKKNKPQKSVFMTTIFLNCETALKDKQNWEVEREFTDETARENYIADMQKAKNRVLGTIRFIASLFANEVIGYNALTSCFNHLLERIKDSESIETLCKLVAEVSEKFILLGKKDVLEKYIGKLKEHQDKADRRIYYMIMDIEENFNKLANPKKETTPEPRTVKIQKNSFDGLRNLTGKPASSHKKNSKETKLDSNGMQGDSDDLKAYIKQNLDENFPDGKENLLKEFIKHRNPSKLLESFVYVILEDMGTVFDQKMGFFLEVAKSFKVNLPEILKNIDNYEIEEIVCDCPFAKDNYEKLKEKAKEI